ncbi:DEAD/DEAH box helicase family protein [Vulcanococcus limneticus Candia 3F8]|uniref:EcoAI/FtnUII family type I restriction enzme subunit R n=1 Tax=Vulcanococcus limneticus TaxID=2170428 RepID=UPI000B97DE2A|nr:type I restriction endonuclease subunit R [Vulcanococcus limneticus]MCP9792920.1 DEAD/DEAH box helicase family protein [Vulcanococcus limneticus MW73D5]MCP9894913.1 DEAD/DEAH box helicase family protein [Vulcanococcus limneticus Candia 3F8]MCP9898358.1 DEAD/DEAH box helicase family protein [Vulcanococcus limneticus Candia 3B3]
MNEAETRAELIDPLLAAAGWGVVEGSRIRREFSITPGRIEGGGRRGKPLTADYVLTYRNTQLAVVEAKPDTAPLSEGVAQAKDYAGKLQLRFTYASNGLGVYAIDMASGEEGPVAAFPSPEELWARSFAGENAWRDRFAAIPYADKGGSWQIRFYQDIAVSRVLEAVATGRHRILLTLATGTGKTSIAFQILWKLFQARWNLSGQPTRRPRILFLADRNTLADQAFNDFTGFAAFEDNALARLEPDALRRKGRVPTNASVFITIFQTFMSGSAADGRPAPWFGQYPPDFFDVIVIDECHRGGANNESTWRGILEYFAPAVQLGLTATPRRTDNADTYAYFGEPVFTYSLKEGINDGFLTPFRVKQITTTLDDYVYTPDDTVVEGEVEAGRRYTEPDFNRIIEIERRERQRVEILLSQIDPRQKTLVFCATQEHALAIRDLINQLKPGSEPNYCHRVTADDGELGNTWLRAFQDNEKTIPTILTTSQKLSTGVDARNVRHIVLLRPVNSMIEFKQIIGRGTRLYDGKDYFTILDFVKAYQLFSDPSWDGDPPEPEEINQHTPRAKPDPAERDDDPSRGDDAAEPPRRTKLRIMLGDGKERSIQHMLVTSFWHPDGTPMSSQQFIELLYGQLPEFVKDEAELRALWSAPDTRSKLLQGLAEKGFGADQLAEMQAIIAAENSDLFDVLAHVAYALPPIPRETRAQQARVYIHSRFSSKQQLFLDFVLQHYVSTGVQELAQEKLAPLLRLRYQNSIADAVADLGRPEDIGQLFAGFQRYLYERTRGA